MIRAARPATATSEIAGIERVTTLVDGRDVTVLALAEVA
jgi:hypothetical protein